MTLIAQIAIGCGAVVTPPRVADRPAADVYLTDYGRHSSILLPAGDDRLVEFAFGDFDWFALNRTRWNDALRALLLSRGSCLGRRVLVDIDDTDELARATGAAKVTRFTVPADRAAKLRDDLQFAYDVQSRTEVFNPASELYFVRAREPYSAFHNCNHVTARWLAELGCAVEGAPITSKFSVMESDVVRQPRTHGKAPIQTPAATQSAASAAPRD